MSLVTREDKSVEAAVALLTLVAAAAAVDFNIRANKETAYRAGGEQMQAIAPQRQRLIASAEQHHRVRKHDGPLSISDSGCLTNVVITPQVSQELGLEDLGPLPLTIKDAGGGNSNSQQEPHPSQ